MEFSDRREKEKDEKSKNIRNIESNIDEDISLIPNRMKHTYTHTSCKIRRDKEKLRLLIKTKSKLHVG